MWKKNKLGAYEWKPTKGGGLRIPKNPRSGWYKHPKTSRTVYYDSKTNTFHDKIGGPAKKLLGIGWDLTGGGIISNATDLAKDALKVGKAYYKYDKANRKRKGEMLNKTLSDTGRLLDTLLVNKTDPGFVDVIDKSGTKKLPTLQTHEQQLTDAEKWAQSLKEGKENQTEAKKASNITKKKVNNIIKNTEEGSEENIRAQNLSKVVEADADKLDAKSPVLAVDEKVTKQTPPKGSSKWVGANSTWVDRGGNVIAPKVDPKLDFKRRRNMFQLTEEERKKIIMTSLEQEMYW